MEDKLLGLRIVVKHKSGKTTEIYTHVSRKDLEEFVRKYPEYIEQGIEYVDHQKRTDRDPLDVLFVDSGKALVVAS